MDVKITINGKQRSVRARTTVFEACREAGVYIPHFCYHPKLSIPANCRMCLVEINNGPKPMPACATYVSDGMAINTESPRTNASQRGVMEFLLINHPLDCPICDQGGECQLQDLAVGYGASATRYKEQKRVVFEKHLGPLISTVMTRCIHCTRCVRFGQEVAGNMELGMIGRGEHAQIIPFIQSTVDSELSGNMIDICPVGALNSKPYRFTARTWELRRTDGVGRHDSWGSFVHVHAKDQQIKRVVPRDHEEINQCWISDRDRFAYTGLNSGERLLEPFVREEGAAKVRRNEWQAALGFAAERIKQTVREHGPEQVGVLLGPQLSCEEAMLAAELFRALDVANIDFRLRQQDFSLDGCVQGVPWLGATIENLYDLDGALLIGADPASELPLLPVRLRAAPALAAKGLHALGALALPANLPAADQLIEPPDMHAATLAALCQCLAGSEEQLPQWVTRYGAPTERHRAFASQLRERSAPAVLLGAQAQHAPDYGVIYRLAELLARLLGGWPGVLVDGANAVGMELVGAVPHRGFLLAELGKPGLNARQMIEQKLRAYVLVDCEPPDFADAKAARAAFERASVVSIGGFFDGVSEYADVMLPAALFGESMGTQVNLEGNAARAEAAVAPPGEARPIWKILRVLANLLDVTGFSFEDIYQAREKLVAAGDFSPLLGGRLAEQAPPPAQAAADDRQQDDYQRLAEVAHFASDATVRRAAPLQETQIARRARQLAMHPEDLKQLGVQAGGHVQVGAAGDRITCEVSADARVARGCVRLPWGTAIAGPLGAAAKLQVRAAKQQAAGASG